MCRSLLLPVLLVYSPVLASSVPANAEHSRFTQASAIHGINSFVDSEFQFQFDRAMYALTAYWCGIDDCCRT